MNQPEPQYGQPAPQWQPQNEDRPQQYAPPPQQDPRQQAQPPYQAPVNPYAPQPAYQQQPGQPGYAQPYQQGTPAQYDAPHQVPQQQPQPPYQTPANPYAPQAAYQQQPGSPQQPYAPAPLGYQQPYASPAAPPQGYQQPYPAPAPSPQGWQTPPQPYTPAAPQYPAPPAAPQPGWQQPPMPYTAPPVAAPPQAYQQPAPALYQPPAQHGPAVSFPPPPNLATPRDKLVQDAGPFLETGEVVYYGFILKLDDTIPETPRELTIAIEGQHHVLGGISQTNKKLSRGLKWTLNPLDAASERLAEKGREALDRRLAGPVFIGGWESQAGLFIRFTRATQEDYGPGAWGVLTDRRYLIFRAGRAGGSSMRLVYAVPRTAIAGVRTEGTGAAVRRGRAPRAELHFTDGSMVATMMATKQGDQVAAILAVQQQPPRY